MLRASAGGVIDPAVADRLVWACQGNPLALEEVPRLLSPEQLAELGVEIELC